MRNFFSCVLALAAFFASSGTTGAGLITIANWTFETSVPTTAGPHSAEGGLQAGVAAATGFHASGTTTYSNPAGNGSPESFSSNNWTTLGDYYQFQVNLSGYQNASVTWDQARSSTGPASFNLQYSTDGTTFTTINSYNVLVSTSPTAWNSTTNFTAFNFGSISLTSAVDNQSTVFVRMSSQSVAVASGTNRIDNVIIQATVVPEPSTMSLLALAVTGVIFVRSRKELL